MLQKANSFGPAGLQKLSDLISDASPDNIPKEGKLVGVSNICDSELDNISKILSEEIEVTQESELDTLFSNLTLQDNPIKRKR